MARRFGRMERTLFCVLAIVCLFSLMMSTMASGAAFDHECSEDGCFICVLVAWNRSGVGGDTATCLLLVEAFVTLTLTLGIVTDSYTEIVTRRTPVCLKVKLLN